MRKLGIVSILGFLLTIPVAAKQNQNPLLGFFSRVAHLLQPVAAKENNQDHKPVVLGQLLQPVVAKQNDQDPAWEKTRRIAEAQHEVVALTIRQNNFNQVLPEVRRIFALQFPARYESSLSEEIEIIADALMHKRQYELAHQVIDEGIKLLTINSNKARVLQKKAYILVKQGKQEEALKYFRQVINLSKSSP
jgi:tetratricopeptide (TPR) repeat protein